MVALVTIGIAMVVLFAGFASAVRRSGRTWTDEEYERERTGGTALGNAFLAAQAILDAGAQHALEQRTVEAADPIEADGPPVHRRVT
jgi:hypothetical protein